MIRQTEPKPVQRPRIEIREIAMRVGSLSVKLDWSSLKSLMLSLSQAWPGAVALV